MIEQWSIDRTGHARFSDCETFRYRLSRALSERAIAVNRHPTGDLTEVKVDWLVGPLTRIVWLMLNPSTANAFQLDPTVNECRKRSIAIGADVLEVVNLFALRSPHPADLKKRALGFRGDDEVNDAEIIAACTGAYRVVAAWGNGGELDDRALVVRRLLAERGIELHHLGLTGDGNPKHPLARGKHRIPAERPLTIWITP